MSSRVLGVSWLAAGLYVPVLERRHDLDHAPREGGPFIHSPLIDRFLASSLPSIVEVVPLALGGLVRFGAGVPIWGADRASSGDVARWSFAQLCSSNFGDPCLRPRQGDVSRNLLPW